MKAKDFAELKAGLTEVLDHARGKVTLKTKDIPLPPRARTITARDIARLRRRLNVSQGVFACWLNVSRDTAISWETGRRKPSGAAVRLLQIVQAQPDILPHLNRKDHPKAA
jgi:putative transcriptional regulator